MLRNAIADILSSLAERIGTYGFLQHRENCLQREFKRVQTNELMRKREAEYEHQTEENFWMEGPPHWRSRYFLQQGYRIVVGEGPTFLHAIGGPSRHENAICSRCNNPFLLIADIDCSDPVFNSEHCSTFENIKRLPLYFCGHCGDSGYRLLDDGGIKVLRKPYPDDTPFEDVPSMLQPQQFELVPIPREIANLIRLACDVDRDWLNTEESTRLAEYLGNGVEMGE